MRKWPSDPTAHVNYEELVTPVITTVRSGFELKRNEMKEFIYDGFEIGAHEQASCMNPDETFSKEGLEYHEERGRDLLDVAINVVFMLGVEQGRRMQRQDSQIQIAIARGEGWDAGFKKGQITPKPKRELTREEALAKIKKLVEVNAKRLKKKLKKKKKPTRKRK